MPEKMLMLALSPTMEEGTIAGWLKKEGDGIANGDVVCEVETDKATMEYEAIQEGTLLRIVVPKGASAVVGRTIAIVGEKGDAIETLLEEVKKETAAQADTTGEGEEASAAGAETKAGARVGAEAQAKEGASESAGAQSAEEEPESPLAELEPEDSEDRIKSSPLAKKMAEEAGVPVSSIKGSGPGGRVVKRDVETAVSDRKAQPQKPAPADESKDRIIPVSPKRKVIAQRLSESKYSAPHYYLKMAVFAESMMKARQDLNAELGGKVSVNAFLIKFVAEAIKKHPVINSTWQGDTIRQFGTIDIALAVAQDDGLVTPVVRDCGRKGIIEIDSDLSSLVERARGNKLTPLDYSNATFTISSLGSYGIEEFTAIINPPGSAILSVGVMRKVPVVNENDEIEIRNQMNLTLSCDHRVIDGARGAEFLRELKQTIEYPVRVLY